MIEELIQVQPDWIDGNGHMHDARYVEVFHVGARSLFETVGLGAAYRTTGFGMFNLGMNLDYFSEVFKGDPLRVTANLLDFSDKLVHMYLEIHQADTGVLSASNERLLIHMNLETRKSAPFPDDIAGRLGEMRARCAAVPRPKTLGRVLAIRR